MANSEHIAWLLEGVESWNKRRENTMPGAVDFFRPDFENANLSEEFYRRVHEQFVLIGTEYMLSGVPLECVNLDFANLKGAGLHAANLTRAYLRDADLTEADLSRADLRGAVLWRANLAKADLHWADLAGANLAGAELWKAILYYLDDLSPDQYQVGHPQVTAIEDLLNEIRNLKNHDAESLLVFRGESQCGWDLCPSVTRDGFITSESAMLVNLISRRPEEFNGITSGLAQWVLAQHHGLRTRFLDITKNPLVALFHACEESNGKDGRLHIFAVPQGLVKSYNSDTVSIIANFAKLSRYDQEALLGKRKCSCHDKWFYPEGYHEAIRRLYQLIRQEKPYFDERIDPRDLYRVFIVEPQHFSERIRAQSGAFLVSAFHERFERDKIVKWENGTPAYAHYKLTIPADCKAVIIEDLQMLNITRENLFPGLDSSAKAVTDFYNP